MCSKIPGEETTPKLHQASGQSNSEAQIKKNLFRRNRRGNNKNNPIIILDGDNDLSENEGSEKQSKKKHGGTSGRTG
jgi:hypothetical protein